MVWPRISWPQDEALSHDHHCKLLSLAFLSNGCKTGIVVRLIAENVRKKRKTVECIYRKLEEGGVERERERPFWEGQIKNEGGVVLDWIA